MIGLACAWRAARAGLSVRVLDAGRAERAAEVSAGMIAPVGEASWGEDVRLEAALASAAAWSGFAAELEDSASMSVPYRRRGSLHVALDRDEAAELRRLHDLHERLGLEASWLRGSDCRRLEPGLSSAAAGGVAIEGEAEIEPVALLAALRGALAAEGGRLDESSPVAAVETEGAAVTGVRLADGTPVAAERVLVAAGARTSALLPDMVSAPAVRPVKGEIVRLRAGEGEMPCERIIVTERVYIVPRDSGEVVLGATMEDRGFDLRVTAGGVHELLREAYRALPDIAELELVDCSAGLRPATADNAPVIGRTEVEGLLVASGHHRNGVLLAPYTAQAIVALLGEGEEPPGLAALGPARAETVRA